MGTHDGKVLGTTKIIDHGADSTRWNLVIMGDGYTQQQLTQYRADVDAFVATFLATRPYDAMAAGINVHRIDVKSAETGADDPTACGGTGASPRTYFDSKFCNSGIRRLLTCNTTTAVTTANAWVPPWNALMMIVNSTVYGGSGGSVACFSLAPSAHEIALHEIGHSAFLLCDEYSYYSSCGDTRTVYTGVEPTAANATINTNRDTLKWRTLVDPATALPTMSNTDCTMCDTSPSPCPTGTVGLFEGSYYWHCGVYRAEYNCRMRTLGQPYCTVCTNRIIEVLTPYMP